MSAVRKAAGLAALATLGLCAIVFIVAALAFIILKFGGPAVYGCVVVLMIFLMLWRGAYRDLIRRGDQ